MKSTRIRAVAIATIGVVLLGATACAGALQDQPESVAVRSNRLLTLRPMQQQDAVIYLVDPDAPLAILKDEIAADRGLFPPESTSPPLISIMAVGTGETQSHLQTEISAYLSGTKVTLIDLRTQSAHGAVYQVGHHGSHYDPIVSRRDYPSLSANSVPTPFSRAHS